jgi:hypothetical protein
MEAMMMASKAKAQKRHALHRSVERFGVAFDFDEAIRKIQAGKAQFVRRQSLRVTMWKVEMAGKEVIAVYDKQRKTIVTVMPNTYGY